MIINGVYRPEVRKCFLELGNQNKAVLGDFRVQMEAHEKFTAGLKLVSQLIDKAARLRGKSAHLNRFSFQKIDWSNILSLFSGNCQVRPVCEVPNGCAEP